MSLGCGYGGQNGQRMGDDKEKREG